MAKQPETAPPPKKGIMGWLITGLVGLIAGAAGGWVDTALTRMTDVFLALPAPILALAVVAAMGPSYIHTLLGVAIVWWPVIGLV